MDMKIAKTPGFSADASLYIPRTIYRTAARGIRSNVQVTPELFRGGGGGSTGVSCSGACAATANACTYNCSPYDSACRDKCDSDFWDCLRGCGMTWGGGGGLLIA
jgi:hypothetical protein